MKILLISPVCPLPLENGGAVRIWNIAKYLSKNQTVDLVCFIRSPLEKDYLEELSKVFNKVTFIERQKLLNAQYLLSSIPDMLEFFSANFKLLWKALFSDRPLLSLLYDSSAMREFVIEAAESKKYDLLYAETYYSISSLKDDLKSLSTPLLLVEQNIESASYKRQSEANSVPLLKMIMRHDVLKIEKEEMYFWNSVDYVGGLSDVDCQTIRNKTGRGVICVTNGVDVDFFSEQKWVRVNDEILFVGSFQYAPNITALRYLIDEVWPAIVSKLPLNLTIKLRIVGKGADIKLKEYVASKGFKIDEDISDIREAFQRATLLLAPLLSGSGTKYKILESMASHLPVVTTSVGAEGLDVKSGKDLYISDSRAGLCDDVLFLLEDSSKRQKIAESAYSFVKTFYDWVNVVSDFEKKLNEKIGKPTNSI